MLQCNESGYEDSKLGLQPLPQGLLSKLTAPSTTLVTSVFTMNMEVGHTIQVSGLSLKIKFFPTNDYYYELLALRSY